MITTNKYVQSEKNHEKDAQTHSNLKAPVMTIPGASKVAPPIKFPIPFFPSSFVGSYNKQAKGHSP